LVGIIAAFTPMLFVSGKTAVQILMIVAGSFWALVNINSLPMVVELAANDRIGSFTGYYYFFSFSAAIVSPSLFGLIHDLTKDYNNLFIYSAVAFLLAFVCMLQVRHGEAKITPALSEEITR
ncbi:MAG: SLC45 family MFS transporter, partial [Ruminococcaceae bacterium]|nr:SLC45 family MFS transporter [Oscillospiraceae bacterium]